MALFDKIEEALDRAGRVAQGAFDEGKIRVEAFRTRQLADKAAQALGYAVFHAKQTGSELDADTHGRLSATLASHEAEAARYEAELDRKRAEAAANRGASSTAASGASTGSTASTDDTAEAPPSAS